MAGVDRLHQATTIFLVFLLLTAVHAQGAGAGDQEEEGTTSRRTSPFTWDGEDGFVPVRSVAYRPVTPEAMPHGEPFQTCGRCRCCSASDGSNCVDTQCCFGIKCNLPGKPFGVCSFSPLACGCGTDNCAATIETSGASRRLKSDSHKDRNE